MELIVEIAKQVPHLAVLVGLVIVFLRGKRESDMHFLDTLKSMDDAWRKSMEMRDEALTHLGDNCHAFQKDLAGKSEAVFERVVESMDKNTEILGRAMHVIERLEARLDGIAKPGRKQ